LRFQRTRVIDVLTLITAKGETNMITTAEETATAQATAADDQPKASKKANVAKRARNVAPSKAKSGKKASPAKKAAKGAKQAKGARPGKAAKEKGVREGSKTEAILALLKRPGGATTKELLKLTSWQPHSLRGFLSGTLRKKMGLMVTSAKGEDGQRSYSVKA
jgi:hypothetical protein